MRTFVRLVGVLVVLPHANFQMYFSRVHNDEVASTFPQRVRVQISSKQCPERERAAVDVHTASD